MRDCYSDAREARAASIRQDEQQTTLHIRLRVQGDASPVIGDVEPREPQWAGNWPNPPASCDPLALDYVVGDGPRGPVWREKVPIYAPVDRQEFFALGPLRGECVSVGTQAGLSIGNLNRGWFDGNSR